MIASLIFWASLITVLYVYAGFPLLVHAFARRKPVVQRAGTSSGDLPRISFLVAALNEEAVLEEKLENCVSMDYPKDRIEFIFVSDGSTDRTNEILKRWDANGIRAIYLPQRGGKMHALKTIFPLCKSDVLVLSDANTFCRPDAVRRMAEHFSDPQVGSVFGDVRIRPSAATFGMGEGSYYRYERWLQLSESRFWSAVGVDGALYALRRDLLIPPSDNIILDDFVLGMNAARQGYRILYDPESIAEEDPTPASGQEFWRKVRVVAGGYQALFQQEGLPRLSQGRLLWMYVSHKLLRWMVPLFLCGIFFSSLSLAPHSIAWTVILGGQALFYLLACLGGMSRLGGAAFRIPYYFILVNVAALLGLVRAIRRKESVLWRKASRVTA